MNPDQTVLKQSDLNPYCLQQRIPKYISRWKTAADANGIMLHFIWVFIVFKSTHLGVSRIQRVKAPAKLHLKMSSKRVVCCIYLLRPYSSSLCSWVVCCTRMVECKQWHICGKKQHVSDRFLVPLFTDARTHTRNITCLILNSQRRRIGSAVAQW